MHPHTKDKPFRSRQVEDVPSFEETLSRLISSSAENKRQSLPSWKHTLILLDDLHALHLMALEPRQVREKLGSVVHILKAQLKACVPDTDVSALADSFLAELPGIRQTLQEDISTALENDPAAQSTDEVALCYPGLRALAIYRAAHTLQRLDVPLLPRLMTEIGHSITGIDIHPGAKIGKRFFIDHGTGIVIGATTIIGDDVKIYQGVTLGSRSFPKSDDGQVIKGLQRHPIIGNRVTIYAGATILGRVHVGAGSVIGGNVWVTGDIPANSKVTQRRARQTSDPAMAGSDQHIEFKQSHGDSGAFEG